jgi:hypothetical protein
MGTMRVVAMGMVEETTGYGDWIVELTGGGGGRNGTTGRKEGMDSGNQWRAWHWG